MKDQEGNTLLSNYSSRAFRYEDGQHLYTDYDEEEARVIVFDDFEYTPKEPLNLTKQEWKMLEPCFVEGDHHICPTYTSALAGQPLTGIKVIMVNDAGEEKETVKTARFEKRAVKEYNAKTAICAEYKKQRMKEYGIIRAVAGSCI